MMAGSGWEEIVESTGLSVMSCRRALQKHLRLLREDREYLSAVSAIATDALRRCHGVG